jgi:quercetin dioxygenase-like cupin family protein
MTRTKTVLTRLLLSASICAVVSLAPAATDEQGFVILQHEELDWGPDLSKIKTIVLHGDPDAPGLYIIRIRFPPGAASRPHSHSTDRFITVIQGTWYAGRGAKFDMNATVPIKAGGFMKHPAGAVHFDGAKDEAVIVEIRGMGPVTTTSAAAATRS